MKLSFRWYGESDPVKLKYIRQISSMRSVVTAVYDVPVAKENDINMAIHPDDPPFDIFGLPRIITGEANIDRFLKLVDSPSNGLTLCTGSLGCTKSNNIYEMINKYSAQGR